MRHVALAAALLAFAPAAQAQDIGTEEVLGVGVVVGSPTGVGGKYYFTRTHAIEAAVATEFFGFGDDRATVYANYLWHPLVVASGQLASVPLHVGGGLQFWTDDLADPPDPDFDEDAAFGLRVPVGLDVNLRMLPIQISGDVAAIVPVIPDAEIGLDLYMNLRYYF